MPKSKHAFIRYQALDKCFRNRVKHYYINDLVEACNKALEEYTGEQEGVKKRQVYEDINFMQSLAGYNAPIEKKKEGRKVSYYYEDKDFSINNQPLNEDEAQELKETLITLNRFKGLPQFDWVESISTRLEASFQLGEQSKEVIEFDQNEFVQGREHIKTFFHAIVDKTVCSIAYRPFQSDESHTLEFHPYYLKQYNNRWFAFGLNPLYDNITNLALDRVEGIEKITKNYIQTEIDFTEYFEDVIGVSFPENAKVEKIILKVDKAAIPYIQSKPLHGSQKLKAEEQVIELELVINFELKSRILQYGAQVEVLSPENLREEIKEEIKRYNAMYL